MGKFGYCIIIFCVCLVFGAGCAELAKIGKVMESGGKKGQEVSTYIPVYGQIFGAISGIVSLIGAGLYRVASRRGTAVQTLIESVKYATENEVEIKAAVQKVSEIKGIQDYINKLVQKYDPPIIKSA